MFNSSDPPEALLGSLEKFLHLWLGPPRPWYGIADEKLTRSRLPEPLRRLYAIAGEWPGDNFWQSAFAFQDHLIPFELLSIRGGKLVFLGENQGCWACGTESVGRDPPVWVSIDGPWEPLGTTLSPFLVSTCLQELLFGCRHTALVNGPMARLVEAGIHLSPLWLDGPYVGMAEEEHLCRRSFYVGNGNLLVMDDRWCGTNSDEARDELAGIFGPPSEPVESTDITIWEVPSIPAYFRKQLLLKAARGHEEQAAHHLRKAESYRRSAGSLEVRSNNEE